MSTAPGLRLRAPAKLNWSLEVLGRRPDGYHEVRTILQTVALSDWLTLSEADSLSLELTGEPGPLADEPPETNLAYRAAERLRRAGAPQAGARMTLEKRIPVAAGLGGGSSAAAAALRGLRTLWRLPLSDEELAALAAELGADVPFFLHGGRVLASGRGDELTALPDGPRQRIVLAWPERTSTTDKTARMYGALRSEQHTDGSATERLAARLRESHAVGDDDLSNAFEDVLDAQAALTFAEARALGRPHLAGSGPSLFFLLAPRQPAAPLVSDLERLGLRAIETHTITTAEATELA